MLTEEQFAALLDAVKGVERLILVGDPGQLPPIGAGRPFVDIVEYLKPQTLKVCHHNVASGYAELTVPMRQKMGRLDVELANTFRGRPLDAGAEEIWQSIAERNSQFVKLIRWNQSDQLQKILITELVNELQLDSKDDEIGFEVSIGGVKNEFNGETYVFFNSQFKNWPGAAENQSIGKF